MDLCVGGQTALDTLHEDSSAYGQSPSHLFHNVRSIFASDYDEMTTVAQS